MQPIQRFDEGDLARQARRFAAVVGRFQQIIFVFADRRKLIGKRRIDMNVARCARTAPTAQRQQFIKAIIANSLHHSETIINGDFARFAGAIGDDQSGHGLRFLFRFDLRGCARVQTRRLLSGSGDHGKIKEVIVGLSATELRDDLDALSCRMPALAAEIARIGYPAPRIRPRGFGTLLRTIVGQQVSVAAAASVWAKLEAQLGIGFAPADLLARDYEALRACGLSRQKQSYARSLCELVEAGAIDFAALPANDEDAIAGLTAIKGIGRWSAEIYLLFAEGRRDIWPAGDLAVQEGMKRLLALPERPTEKQARTLAEKWTPQRGAMAIFTWHFYANPAL